MFSHQLAKAISNSITIVTVKNHTISSSMGHYLIATKANMPANFRTLVRAADIRVGDFLWTASSTELEHVLVARVIEGTMQGLFNPHTPSGTIVVNGLAAATFTDSIFPSIFLHAIVTLPARGIYTMAQIFGLNHLLGSLNSAALQLFFSLMSISGPATRLLQLITAV